VLQNRQALQALLRLGCQHGGAVVAEHGAWQPPFLKCLAQAVDERLGVLLSQVPLSVAAQPRVIVEDAEQHGPFPLACGQEQAALGFMEVEVPERVHVTHLERAALAGDEVRLELVAARFSAFAEPVLFHVPADARVARKRAQGGVFSGHNQQVVVHQPGAPARVLAA
jgi:hypothetical protein